MVLFVSIMKVSITTTPTLVFCHYVFGAIMNRIEEPMKYYHYLSLPRSAARLPASLLTFLSSLARLNCMRAIRLSVCRRS